MICSKCGQTKSDYHFYSRLGKTFRVTRFFFINPDFSPLQCWECNGDYRCLGCGEVKNASQFRVGGRFCHTCKEAGIYKVLTEAYALPEASTDVGSLDSVETPEIEANS
jgi:hypothetical protein